MFYQLCIAVAIVIIGFSMAAFARYLRKNSLWFLDEEWVFIQQKAKTKNITPREYLYSLVEKDT